MDEFILNLKSGLTLLFSVLDWVYMVMFIIVAYTLVRMLGESNFCPKLKVKIRKRWIVFGTAALLAGIFGLFYWIGGGFPWYNDGKIPYTFTLFLSMAMSVCINEIFGIEKILDKWLKVKLKK